MCPECFFLMLLWLPCLLLFFFFFLFPFLSCLWLFRASPWRGGLS
ncbi:putative membrane protein [Escherichia coli 2-474-04_S4_C2]|nr:putative membrane protein [Escherichia coli 2-474-04_S4_C2]KDZ10792.1 putative membrane protein [Escherichia coli 2-474-04_S4_C3]KEN81579.1 putative membrane protein [Escherichia coli 2-474-04_S4_C1]